jgi:hypothetical protein
LKLVKHDWLTVAAIGVLAMVAVTFDHEALGHGSFCLGLGGHITLLSTSLFRCDAKTNLIDAGGPIGNLLMGSVALLAFRLMDRRRAALRLFCITVFAFSFFWESGYAVKSMLDMRGDYYGAISYFMGGVTPLVRATTAAIGVVVFVATIGIARRGLLQIESGRASSLGLARQLWLSATLGSAVAALFFRRPMAGNLRDTVMELGIASVPMLLMPWRETTQGTGEAATIGRSPVLIALAGTLYAAFVLTMGRGLGS